MKTTTLDLVMDKPLANAPYVRPQEMAPASMNGIIFGVRSRILVRSADYLLVWVPGHTIYLNRMQGSGYGSSSLQVVGNKRPVQYYRTLVRGGRLNEAMLKSKAVEIDELFGEGTAAAIDLKATFALGTPDWFQPR